ncbi:neuronal acetylcholine receptor subunit alpha-10-like [Glandiceps talaboti]
MNYAVQLSLKKLSIICGLYLCFFQITASEGTTNRGLDKRVMLHHHLFENYSVHILPVAENNDVVLVRYGFSIHHVVSMEEKHQMITYNIWCRQSWEDRRLTWNASDFGGIGEIVVASPLVWRPEMRNYNSVGDERETDLDKTHVRITSEGKVRWHYPTITTISCKMDVHNFPFDDQCCPMKIGPWVWDGRDVDIAYENEEGASTDNFESNGVWDIIDVKVNHSVEYYYCCPGVPYPSVTYVIHLRRRFQSYILRLTVPTMCLCILSVSSFFLPPESGERIGLCMTSLLTMFVFYQLIADEIPPTSQIPSISLYISIDISLMVLNCIVTIGMLHVYHRGSNKNAPLWMKKLASRYVKLTKCLCIKRQKATAKDERHEGQRDTVTKQELRKNESKNYQHNLSKRMCTDVHLSCDKEHKHPCVGTKDSDEFGDFQKRVNGNSCDFGKFCTDIVSRYEMEDERTGKVEEWRFLASVIDRILFLLFVVSFSVATIIYIVQSLISAYEDTHC